MTGRRVAGVVVAIAVMASARGVAAPRQEGRPAAVKATADQLAFIAGAWSGTLNDRVIEQHWSMPAAGSMIAMYRSIRDGKPTLYELLAVEEEAGSLVLRIKHFKPGPGLASQEARDESVDHRLVRVDGRTAVFEGSTAAGPSRVTFTRVDPDTLTITVERQREGKPSSTEFKYKRLPPPGVVGG